ncbi:MAG: VCBS repeat-containing protein, partial [Candidatus Cloacimonadaceae bacterium]|nr:VCBS repeat-containing protein [Candidatus Cloacimonadaceae bacterium]
VNISYPYDQLGLTDSFDILGTVHGADFFRYSVMYSSKAVPSALDWYDVNTHTNQPVFCYQPVQNGVIAHFNLLPGMADGAYMIRVIYENGTGRKYHYYRTVRLVRTPPSLITQSLYGFKRYDKQNLRYYISAKFTDTVHGELEVIASNGSSYFSHAPVVDSLQVWALPSSLPEGPVSIRIRAYNISNLEYVSPLFTNFMYIAYSLVPTHGFVATEIGAPRVPMGKTYDFNGNGLPEYVSMDLPSSGYGRVRVFEPYSIGHFPTYDFAENFWPLDIGNTNQQGMELLYLSADTAHLMDTKPGSVYPDTLIWSDTAISGGVIADFSGDNIKDILLVKNLPNARVIQAYSRNASGVITARNTLTNTTPTTLRNTFVPSIIVEKFDTDNYPDILTADTDGDIMIFEIYNNSSHEMTWTYRLPVGNAYYMCAGDFDGNGRKDFMVGGYYRDILNPNMNFWYFEGFRNQGDNNYVSMGHIMFNDILSQNGIYAYDLDGDGKDEIVMAISPNLYVVKYIDGKFVPTWYGESFRTYQITAWRDQENKAYFLTNAKYGDSEAAMEWTADVPFDGPPTPINFICQP